MIKSRVVYGGWREWVKSYLRSRIARWMRSRCDGCHTSVQCLLSSLFFFSVRTRTELTRQMTPPTTNGHAPQKRNQPDKWRTATHHDPLNRERAINLPIHTCGTNQTNDSTNWERPRGTTRGIKKELSICQSWLLWFLERCWRVIKLTTPVGKSPACDVVRLCFACWRLCVARWRRISPCALTLLIVSCILQLNPQWSDLFVSSLLQRTWVLHVCFQTVFPVPLVQFTLQFSAVHRAQNSALATDPWSWQWLINIGSRKKHLSLSCDLRSCCTSSPSATVIAAYQAEEKSTLNSVHNERPKTSFTRTTSMSSLKF